MVIFVQNGQMVLNPIEINQKDEYLLETNNHAEVRVDVRNKSNKGKRLKSSDPMWMHPSEKGTVYKDKNRIDDRNIRSWLVQ